MLAASDTVAVVFSAPAFRVSSTLLSAFRFRFWLVEIVLPPAEVVLVTGIAAAVFLPDTFTSAFVDRVSSDTVPLFTRSSFGASDSPLFTSMFALAPSSIATRPVAAWNIMLLPVAFSIKVLDAIALITISLKLPLLTTSPFGAFTTSVKSDLSSFGISKLLAPLCSITTSFRSGFDEASAAFSSA